MRRHVVLMLAVASLFVPSWGVAQTTATQHEEVQVIDDVPPRAPDEKVPDVAGAVEKIVDATNAFRKEEGRRKVAVSDKLAEAARGFAGYMARTGRYGHTADDRQPSERSGKAGYESCLVAENIAYAFDSRGYTDEGLAKTFVEGWENSPGHRRNMLDPDVTETGVAVARSEKTGHYFAVQMFGRPRSLAVGFRVENRSGSTVTYKVDDQEFTLEPRYTRTHQQCRPPAVTFELPAGEEPAKESRRPEGGEKYVIIEEGGALKLKDG